jgi:hypothetical protein
MVAIMLRKRKTITAGGKEAVDENETRGLSGEWAYGSMSRYCRPDWAWAV